MHLSSWQTIHPDPYDSPTTSLQRPPRHGSPVERSPRGLDLNPFEGKSYDLCDMRETSAMKVPTKRDTKTRDFSHIPLPVGTFEDEWLLFPRQVGYVSSLQNTIGSFQECLLLWFIFLQFVLGEGVSWFDTKRYNWVAGFLDASDLGTFVKQTSPVWDGTNMWKVDEWLFYKMDAPAGKTPTASTYGYSIECHQMHIHQKMKMISTIESYIISGCNQTHKVKCLQSPMLLYQQTS